MIDKAVQRRETLQRKEFDAADEFTEQFRRYSQTPIVDDDYPEVRHCYERAMTQLIAAMKANGRFGKGNRYGLQHVHDASSSKGEPA